MKQSRTHLEFNRINDKILTECGIYNLGMYFRGEFSGAVMKKGERVIISDKLVQGTQSEVEVVCVIATYVPCAQPISSLLSLISSFL